DRVSLTSSAHTYRLLVFKEHSARGIEPSSSAAFSAAEKRDYEPCFADRQLLFATQRCDCGVLLPSPAARPRLQHTVDSASPSALRCRQRERGVILGTRDQTRKRFVKIV
ncbi:hypothetical protein, partial [Burkholderia pseudomultivorans]|uniref:hypothetical protein n=1 Tax=Burkholderia pseudomultivorans TaxID=1207504 RepID=UPI001E4955B6